MADEHAAPPMPDAYRQNAAMLSYVGTSKAFTAPELDRITAWCESLQQQEATLATLEQDLDAQMQRRSRTAWVERQPQTEWLYARMEQVAAGLNAHVYQFDLNGFSEPFQYAVYNAGERAHFDWHVDQGPMGVSRKLSFTLQLSDPSDYEGGDLEFMICRKVDLAPKQRGMLIAFPSYTLHRVTPVTDGVRKSLVIWATGPRFR